MKLEVVGVLVVASIGHTVKFERVGCSNISLANGVA